MVRTSQVNVLFKPLRIARTGKDEFGNNIERRRGLFVVCEDQQKYYRKQEALSQPVLGAYSVLATVAHPTLTSPVLSLEKEKIAWTPSVTIQRLKTDLGNVLSELKGGYTEQGTIDLTNWSPCEDVFTYREVKDMRGRGFKDVPLHVYMFKSNHRIFEDFQKYRTALASTAYAEQYVLAALNELKLKDSNVITVLTDNSCRMARVNINGRGLIEGNFHDFHPGCYGNTLDISLSISYGWNSGAHSFATALARLVTDQGKSAVVQQRTYKWRP